MKMKEEISTHLEGDWTISTITQRANSLMEFSTQQSEVVLQGLVVNIDCSGIEKIDVSGLQLLYVWLQCMNLKGFRTKLTNISAAMREMLVRMGLHTIFETQHLPLAA
ncbi:lipid asymmetry maintenance protein MlaB [Geobacter sp. SVR]|uniref:STAS domain-containing protein n=1 Tax=Geobacter sp. SVR TaxID=2495594 RepID=UPI00143EF77B|nr:STAS domain-containing protein [Geobacter sp. SVR]BCS53967.1 hypothetical protein GSVR_22750 [Geobacter sp. SVR]GCF86252.1 hypothetical protein GSbR_28520 [Geobacter sp. SVR]